MKKINREPLILNSNNEVGVVDDYNAAVYGAGNNQVAIATGLYGIASVTGAKNIAIATGQNGVATALSECSLAIGWGGTTKVKGVLNSYIAAAEVTPEEELVIQLKKVDGVNIKADTWYSLIDGELEINE